VETTVPQQALFAFNHPFVIERSTTVAKKAFDSKTANPSSHVEFLYRQILSRNPKINESKLAVEFLGPHPKLANFEDLAQTLLVSNEFFFTD
jgi:2-oxo-4-hydroxy-4-carboxy--5-ureidoimidazoline (OHCU) decarboxylase